MPLGKGEASRTACAPGVLRTAVDEETNEPLSAAALAERVRWAVCLVSGMADELTAGHHPPPPGRRARRASVRRGTHQRAGPGCPVQLTGTRA